MRAREEGPSQARFSSFFQDLRSFLFSRLSLCVGVVFAYRSRMATAMGFLGFAM